MIGRYIKAISNLKSIRTSSADDRSLKKTIRGKEFNSNKIIFLVNMGHELINILFSKLGGGDSFNKKVPSFIFNLSRKYMKIYYNYYIKGDGCRKSNGELDFVITTASIKMAAGVNLLNNLLFKKHSRIIISKGKYYDISPVKSLKYIKKKVNKIENIKDVKVYDIIVDGTSTFVDACGNVLLHNCDALGSKYKGKFTGTFGHIATFSFYPAHHITMGEGGALATNDPLLRRLILSFRDWGRDCWCEPGHDDTCQRRFSWQLGKLPFGYDHKYTYSHIGYNLKVTDLQAAIGVAQLEKLPAFIKARQDNFAFLSKLFKKYESYFILPQPTRQSEPSWFGFPLMVQKKAPFTRADIVNCLEENKIATRMLFGGNLTKQPAYEGMKYRVVGKLDNTDLVMNNLFWIGVYPGITKEKLTYIARTLTGFMEQL
ncbi:MAG: DegT/DnrJ/EryC1/StrS family aminotransferase [Elusimicrobia bacterium]|nr:DegT/DnrJ/EryC1/StrS family aminotransferase [Elusimicrobiota bacterium]